MKSIITEIIPIRYDVIKFHTQTGHITTNLRVKIDFTSSKISATEILTWKFHVDDSAKDIYDMISGRYLLT